MMLCVIFSGFSESVFKLDPLKDSIIGSAALGLTIPAFVLDASSGKHTTEDEINALDRQLMYKWNEPLDTASTVLGIGMLALPAISVIDHITEWKILGTYGIMYTEAFLLTFSTKELIKNLVARDRPYTYFGDIPSGEQDDYFNSFPSGHTSYAFLGAGFLSSVFLFEYPDSQWKIPIIAGSYALASTVGLMRIFSGSHFVTDVLVGAAIGSVYGWGIPFLHVQKKEKSPVTLSPLPLGLMVSVNF
jgi:membrane-associated phospholipid phosphatase